MTFDIGMMLGLVLHDDENAAMLRGIGEDRAMCMMEQYFSPLALEAIQTHGSPDFLPGEMEGQTFPPRDGYCERQMILTVTIPNTFNLRHAPWR